jgi:hypothetical protein
MKPKLLDVFLFYNELDLLKARLEYLGPLVDHFIISEANIDFSGRPKSFLLSQALLNTLPFAHKIIYHREHLNLNSIPYRLDTCQVDECCLIHHVPNNYAQPESNEKIVITAPVNRLLSKFPTKEFLEPKKIRKWLRNYLKNKFIRS